MQGRHHKCRSVGLLAQKEQSVAQSGVEAKAIGLLYMGCVEIDAPGNQTGLLQHL
jgi:hypothetical protein